MSRSIAYRYADGDVELVRWSRNEVGAANDIALVLDVPVSVVLARLTRIGPYLAKAIPRVPRVEEESA